MFSSAPSLTSPKSIGAQQPKLLRVRSMPPVRAAATAAPASPTSAAAAATPSLYDVLGVHAGATGQEIKAAYRRLARSLHPDVVAGDRKNSCADEFIRVNSAYATLSDPAKRGDYDRRLLARGPVPAYSLSHSYSSSYAGAATTPTPVGSPSFVRFSRRSWETDQCW